MDKQNLSRRKVLSGLLVSGGAGALVGRGTTALFSDEETFSNSSIEASASIAGVVDLEVDVESLSNADGIVYSINLPDGVNNNPSYIWVRAKTCPKPINVADNIEVELRVECESQTDDYSIGSGKLIEVINSLRNGTMIKCTDSGEDQCFQPGENVDLILKVTDVPNNSTSSIEFEFEFYGEQCRYNTGAENPFDPLSKCPTPTPRKAISFIAFCSESGDSLALGSVDGMITDIPLKDDNDPLEVEWKTKNAVDYVVVKSGQNFTIYDYSDDSDGPSDGTVVTGGDPEADFYGSVYGSAKNGFGKTESFANNSGTGNSASSVPCELAADIVGDGDFPDDGTSYKLEWNGNKFEEDN